MASAATETTLIPRGPVQNLVPQKKPKSTLLKIMDELGEILTRWEYCQDALSQKLVNAGLKVLDYTCNHLTVPLDMEAAIEKIELIRQVLIYPRTNSLYLDPWLVEGVATWEKSDLDEYQAFAKRFSNKPVEAEPHRFALAILGWLKNFPAQPQTPTLLLENSSSQSANSNTSLVVLPKDVQDFQTFRLYELAITQSRELQQELIKNRENKEMLMLLERENIMTFHQFEQTLQRQEDSYMETAKEQEKSLKSLTKQHAETVNLSQKRDLENQQAIANLSGKLNECKTQMNWQQQEIANLRASLQSSQAQLSQARNDLNNSDSGGCSVM